MKVQKKNRISNPKNQILSRKNARAIGGYLGYAIAAGIGLFLYSPKSVLARDYGDAPDTFGTDATAGNSTNTTDPIGASHVILSGIQLGATAPDAEADGQPTTDATGDDSTVSPDIDDEDGISTFPTLTEGDTTYTIPAANITLTNTTAQQATLHAWIDFNKDGIFQSTEYASAAVNSAINNGNPAAALTWNGISAGAAGNTFARFRLTTDPTINANTPGGAANDGEVEDYQIAIAAPIPASGPTFACDNTLFQGINQPTEFFIINTSTNSLDRAPFNVGNVITNALGFNITDGYIYGVDRTSGLPNSGKVYRIASDGTVTDLGNPPQAPDAFAGDFDRNGIFFVHQSPPGNSGLFRIDVSGSTATDIGQPILLSNPTLEVSDMAFNPIDDRIYAIDEANGNVVQIDPVSGQTIYLATSPRLVTPGPNGAVYFDAFGAFFAYENDTGILYKYELDLVNNTALGEVFATGPGVSFNDGTACPYNVQLQKTVAPEQINAGGRVTYTYTITNQNTASFTNINLSDTLADGRTYVAGTLNRDPLLGAGLNLFIIVYSYL